MTPRRWAGVPEDVARLIEQFKRDPIGTLRSLGPSLSGINVALTPESVAAARALATARGAASAAETALPETYAPPEVTAKDPVGRRGFPLRPAARRNSSAAIEGREYSGHALAMMQVRGYTPGAVEEAIATGRRGPGNTPGTSAYIDGKNGVEVIVDDRSGRVVSVILADIVKFVMKGHAMTEAERRLYEVTRQWIRDYDAHRMDLVRLASELLGLVPHLAEFDKPWTVRFEQIAFDLEVLVAVALANEQKDLTDAQYRRLDRRLNALDALVDEKLGPRA